MSDETTVDASGDEVRVHADRDGLCAAAARELLSVLSDAVAERGAASAVLTGGGTGTGILAALAALLEDGPVARAGTESARAGIPEVDWTRVHLWWGDERHLPAGDPQRNEVQAAEALTRALADRHGMPSQNVHPMPVAGALDPEAAAVEYADRLRRHAPADPGPDPALPAFDVVMLGVGPDAHVASLFPGLPGPAVSEGSVIGVRDSPKPPPQRVSLTVGALNTARRVWFVVAGADKRDAVAQVRRARNARTTDAAVWPASVVRGRDATTWWLDGAAAGG